MDVFNLRRLPARLDAQQTADLLGFQHHDVPVLIRQKLLSPLGNPPQAATKWFSSSVVLALASDDKWLAKATRVLTSHWQQKNRNKKKITTPL